MIRQIYDWATRATGSLVRRLLPSCFAQERKCVEQPRRCVAAENEPSERRQAFLRRCAAGPAVSRRRVVGGVVGLAAAANWRIDGSILFGADSDSTKVEELPPPEDGQFTVDIIGDLVGLTDANEKMLRETPGFRADLANIAKLQGDELGRMCRLDASMDEIEGCVKRITAKCEGHREMVLCITKELNEIRQMDICFEKKKSMVCKCMEKAKTECKRVTRSGSSFDWAGFFRFLFKIFMIVMFVMLIVGVTSGAGAGTIPFFCMPKPRDMELPGPERKFKFGPRRL